MSSPSVIEPDDPPAPAPAAREADPVARMQQHLLWMRHNRFAASVIQIGDITMHGVEDRMPRGLPGGGDKSDGGDLPPWATDVEPGLQQILDKAKE